MPVISISVSRHPAFKCLGSTNIQGLVCDSRHEKEVVAGALQHVPSCHPGWENMENMENTYYVSHRTWKTSVIYFTPLMSTFETNHNIRAWRTWFWVSSRWKNIKWNVKPWFWLVQLIYLVVINDLLSNQRKSCWMIACPALVVGLD